MRKEFYNPIRKIEKRQDMQVLFIYYNHSTIKTQSRWSLITIVITQFFTPIFFFKKRKFSKISTNNKNIKKYF